MGSNNLFAGVPSINIPRSRWNNDFNVTGTFKHGFLVPVDFIPILPGDSVSLTIKDLTRMQTPITAIFGNIKQHFAAFFVPWRLIWEHAEEFFGANKTSAGYQTGTYTFPIGPFDRVEVGSLSHYLGKPLKAASDTDADGKTYYAASMMKERAYYLIWSEYFRPQQIVNPAIPYKTDSNVSNPIYLRTATFNGSGIHPGDGASSLMKVAKRFDYFTASTLSPQYGPAVEIPLGTLAPVIPAAISSGVLNYNPDGTNLIVGKNDGSFLTTPGSLGNTSGALIGSYGSLPSGAANGVIGSTNLFADLEHAAAAKINDIRYAFAIQKYLERANFSGNYFFGILQVHYGVTSPDSRLQRPEFLGEFSEDILIHQVVSTADTTNSGVKTPVGNVGAMSVTASGAFNLCNKAFVEPGYLCIVRWCRQRQVYSQGVMREDFKQDRFEVYTPELCNLGDQATLTREIYWKAGEETIFGSQEHWAEYRYRPDRVTGILDPNYASALKYYTLAHKFTTEPQLNDAFVMEDRKDVDDALTTGSALDEYLSDTWLNITWTREMPVRTMPGLIDHFGAM